MAVKLQQAQLNKTNILRPHYRPPGPQTQCESKPKVNKII